MAALHFAILRKSCTPDITLQKRTKFHALWPKGCDNIRNETTPARWYRFFWPTLYACTVFRLVNAHRPDITNNYCVPTWKWNSCGKILVFIPEESLSRTADEDLAPKPIPGGAGLNRKSYTSTGPGKALFSAELKTWKSCTKNSV